MRYIAPRHVFTESTKFKALRSQSCGLGLECSGLGLEGLVLVLFGQVNIIRI